MALVIADRVKETATGTTTTLNLAGAVTGFQTFVAGIGNGNTCPYVIADADGAAWEVGIGTVTDASPDTLARTTILQSSNSDATVTLSAGTHTVWVDDIGLNAYRGALDARGHISGLEHSYSTASIVGVAAGSISINNKVFVTAAQTLTAGTTMVDFSASAITLAASSAYFLWAYDNAGTLALKTEKRTGSGNGADPSWDEDLGYWKHPTITGARRIGKFWTNSSSQIMAFDVVGSARHKTYTLRSWLALTLVSAGTQTTYGGGAITITPYCTADDEQTLVHVSISHTGGSAGASSIALSVNGTDDYLTCKMTNMDNGGSALTPGPTYLPYTGSLHYKVANATTDQGYLRLSGYGAFV